eukprot:CAMPEP_0168364376 /NCGR_PEP_ID=MMETSP0228-20121227/4174_1 /TAXON_ID=133427 /ORGANISM="Protoceratium reticulatum, Strain CCCM 535 (=CCMP 1889)" /LENGTH=156 /DNA_ID=CAMNT_0008377131 /DNA_START=37 /DNA_END=504 /DNA_ORIENTATION=+
MVLYDHEERLLSHELLTVQQETDAFLHKCSHFEVEERAWKSINQEFTLASLLDDRRNLHDKLMAVQQDFNDTCLAQKQAESRLEQVTNELHEEIQEESKQVAMINIECDAAQHELDEEVNEHAGDEKHFEELLASRSLGTRTSQLRPAAHESLGAA